MGDARESLAEDRTNWAHERTRLAKERTFAAWLRTGLATAGLGILVVKAMPSVEPRWLVRALGVMFVSTGGIVFLLGFRTYYGILRKLEKEGVEGTPAWFIGALTVVLALGSVLGLVLVLME
jgi:putative membrane protein